MCSNFERDGEKIFWYFKNCTEKSGIRKNVNVQRYVRWKAHGNLIWDSLCDWQGGVYGYQKWHLSVWQSDRKKGLTGKTDFFVFIDSLRWAGTDDQEMICRS